MKPSLLMGALALGLSVSSFADTLEVRHLELAEGNIAALRVTLSEDLEVIYRGASTHSVSSGAGIEERFSHIRHSVKISQKTFGGIVDVSPNLRTIWVSFDSNCQNAECAYTFMSTDEGYVLSAVPEREGMYIHTAMIRNSALQRRRWFLDHIPNDEPYSRNEFYSGSSDILFALPGRQSGRHLKLNISSDQIVEYQRTSESARGF